MSEIEQRDGVETQSIKGKVFQQIPYHEDFFRCSCHSLDHSLIFSFWEDQDDDDEGYGLCELYAEIHLDTHKNFFKRLWAGIRYALGFQCRYGHWDSWTLQEEDVQRLKTLLDKYEKCGKNKI